MKKIVKKSIALLCVFAMCLTYMGSYANYAQASDFSSSTKGYVEFKAKDINKYLSKGSDAAKGENINKINSDLKILGKLGVISEEKQINTITIDANDNISYFVTISNYKNLISVDSKSPEVIKITAKQDDISNTITIYNDGRLYVDGKLIEAKVATTIDDTVVANSYEYWDSSPWWGSSSDYKYYAFTDQCSNVPLSNAISALTVSAFIAVVGWYFSFGLGTTLIATFLGGVYTYFNQNAPYTTNVSYIAPCYYMNSGTPYIPELQGFCYQYRFAFYSSTNYQDYAYSRTYYKLDLPYV